MQQEQRRPVRYRVYQVVGIVVGVLFLALAATAYSTGGGLIIPIIAAVGGVLCIAGAVVAIVRSRG